MMEQDTVNFKSYKWTHYLPLMYKNQSHADVTLVCEGQQILLHRSVLASLSPFFEQLLNSCESSLHPPVILLEGFRYTILVSLINFFYNGVVEGSSNDLITITKYAKELEIKGIVNSGQDTKPLKLELLEKKSKVNEQLQNLQSSISDSEASSLEEDDLKVLYERIDTSVVEKNIPPETKSVSFKSVPQVKRPLSPSLVSQHVQQKKIALVQKSSLLSEEGTSDSNSYHSAPIRIHRCSICKKVFSTNPLLRTHLGTSHAETLTCSICDKLYTTRSALKRHLNNHISKLDGLLSSVAAPTNPTTFQEKI